MAPRPGRFRVDDFRKIPGDAVERGLVRDRLLAFERALAELRSRVVAGDPAPEVGVPREGEKDIDESWIKPCPAAFAGDIAGRLRTAGCEENLNGLRQRGDSPAQRNLLAP